ncbi:hypothetical protein IHV09_05140 [Fictibacillus sp. 23RED33]|jgi:hypothetical protein|uniref:hypothetical protein n=1 Tax=Fictibacillus sp. 23RED33 TaxID=2745879 RepID=UPI0018CEFE97|nr:hypothetical protein [Fictibacillus sp. 23RED33]MBH0172929.1 hypothetical protein [Fictibacillus sp. 23RED33]
MIGNNIRIISWILFGSLAGILLACFFYVPEVLFGLNLYTFLLNIDFLPLPDSVIYNEPFQFVLHIIIAIILIAFVDLFCRIYYHPYQISLIINVIMSFTFFPLYHLAVEKPFSAPLTLPFIIWLLGHILFAIIIAYFVTLLNKKRSTD